MSVISELNLPSTILKLIKTQVLSINIQAFVKTWLIKQWPQVTGGIKAHPRMF